MSTAAPFDPCRHWLGVSALELDDPWKLLGLAAGEADAIRILQASEARLAHLRAVEAGPYEVARRALVSRVEEARDRLLAMASGPSPTAGGVPPRTGLAMPPPPPGARDPVIQAAPFPPHASPVPAPYPQPSFTPQPSFAPQPSFVPQHSHPAQPFAPVAAETPPQHDPFAFRTGPVYRRKSNHGPLLAVTAALLAAVVGMGLYAVNMKPKPAKPTPNREEIAEDPPSRSKPRETAQREERRTEPPKQETDDDPPSGVLGQREPPPQPRMRDASPEPVEANPANVGRGEETDAPLVKPVKPEPPMAGSLAMSKDGTDAASDTKPVPADEPSPEAPVPAPPTPAPPAPGTPDEPDMLAKIDKGVKTCLEALMRKEFDTATRALKPLEEIATEKREADRIAGWQQLVEYSKGFLDYRDQAIDAMKSGDEYDVNGKKIAIVEVNDTEVVVQVLGMQKTWERGSLPAAVELAIVTSWFDANPANMLYLGASYFARPEPDLEKAKEHWSKAMIGGANASLLLPLLKDPVVVESLGEG